MLHAAPANAIRIQVALGTASWTAGSRHMCKHTGEVVKSSDAAKKIFGLGNSEGSLV